MARKVQYTDEHGNVRDGWYNEGHVYQDEGLTTPIGVGSKFRADNGNVWQMTPYGGQLYASPNQVDANGNWIPQGNPWYQQAQDIWGRISNREPFQFDINGNALYEQYKDQYQTLGRQAMQDTMGQAAGLTGGYGSTYGQRVGQQTYQQYLDRLNDIVPELYAQERTNYDNETSQLYQQLGAAQGFYGDAYNQWAADRSRADQLDQQQYERAQNDKQYAYTLAMAMLQGGMMPTDDMLATAGISAEDAAKLQQFYSQQINLSRYGGGGGNGYYAAGSSNDLPVYDTVPEWLQAAVSNVGNAVVNAVGGYKPSQGYMQVYQQLGNTKYEDRNNLIFTALSKGLITEDEARRLYELSENHKP